MSSQHEENLFELSLYETFEAVLFKINECSHEKQIFQYFTTIVALGAILYTLMVIHCVKQLV